MLSRRTAAGICVALCAALSVLFGGLDVWAKPRTPKPTCIRYAASYAEASAEARVRNVPVYVTFLIDT